MDENIATKYIEIIKYYIYVSTSVIIVVVTLVFETVLL